MSVFQASSRLKIAGLQKKRCETSLQENRSSVSRCSYIGFKSYNPRHALGNKTGQKQQHCWKQLQSLTMCLVLYCNAVATNDRPPHSKVVAVQKLLVGGVWVSFHQRFRCIDLAAECLHLRFDCVADVFCFLHKILWQLLEQRLQFFCSP